MLCWRRIRKFDENKQTENRQPGNSKPEATLIPMDPRSEWANIWMSIHWTTIEMTMMREQLFVKLWTKKGKG